MIVIKKNDSYEQRGTCNFLRETFSSKTVKYYIQSSEYFVLPKVSVCYKRFGLNIYPISADLSVGCVLVLTDIVWKLTITWYAGNVGCKLVKFAQCVATYGATYSLVALSIDRLDAIARPMSINNVGM